MDEKEEKKVEIVGISIWRIFAYFIIYSVFGFIIETLFALISYNVLESRQSFLYGPFCGIYGIGAVVMIIYLQYFNKNNYTLFLGGFIVGSIVEYFLSLLGEIILNVKWWDYSNKFLNINGRICLIYSVIWGLLAIYLIKKLNPVLDKIINFGKEKINRNILKSIIIVSLLLLFIDTIVSGIAIYLFRLRIEVKNNLNCDITKIEEYNKIYGDNKKAEFICKYWNDEKMMKTYPNLTIKLNYGKVEYIKRYFPNIKPYYYKW